MKEKTNLDLLRAYRYAYSDYEKYNDPLALKEMNEAQSEILSRINGCNKDWQEVNSVAARCCGVRS